MNSVLWDKHITKNTKIRFYNTIAKSIWYIYLNNKQKDWKQNKSNRKGFHENELQNPMKRQDYQWGDQAKMVIEKAIIEYNDENTTVMIGDVRRVNPDKCIKKTIGLNLTSRRKREKQEKPRKAWRNEIDDDIARRYLEDGGC